MTQRNPKKLSFETPEIKLELTTKIPLDVDHNIFFLEKAKELLQYISDKSFATTETITPVVKIKAPSKTEELLTPDKEILKERLPNPVMKNGMFIEPSDVKKIETYESLCRCPNCGQHKALILNLVKEDKYIFMKVNAENSYDFIEEWESDGHIGIPDSCFLSQSNKKLTKADYQDFIKSIDDLPVKPNDVVFDSNETIGHCPFCREANIMSLWQEAYDHPENFFEYGNLCKDCGGEIETINKRKKEKPYSVSVCIRCGKEHKNNESE